MGPGGGASRSGLGGHEHLPRELDDQGRRELVDHLRQEDAGARADEEAHVAVRLEGQVDAVPAHADGPLVRVRHVEDPLPVLRQEARVWVCDDLLLVSHRPAGHLRHVVVHHLPDPALDPPHHEAVAEDGAVEEVRQRPEGRTDVVVGRRVARGDDHV